MTETIFVVLDFGDIQTDGSHAVARGAYAGEDEAQERRDEVNGPFKNVRVVRTEFHGDLDELS